MNWIESLISYFSKLFIEQGAQVNKVNIWGRSAVHSAAFYGMTEILQILTTNGADIYLRDVNGHTPLIDAARGESATTRGFFKSS